MKDPCARVGARVDLVGLGAGEPGGDDDLGAVEEDVQTEVVAVEGDAPGVGGGGAAEEDEVVGEGIADCWAAAEFAEEVVDAHGGDGLGVPFGGEGCAEEGHDRGSDFG
jgi:hypothetical protein